MGLGGVFEDGHAFGAESRLLDVGAELFLSGCLLYLMELGDMALMMFFGILLLERDPGNLCHNITLGNKTAGKFIAYASSQQPFENLRIWSHFPIRSCIVSFTSMLFCTISRRSSIFTPFMSSSRCTFFYRNSHLLRKYVTSSSNPVTLYSARARSSEAFLNCPLRLQCCAEVCPTWDMSQLLMALNSLSSVYSFSLASFRASSSFWACICYYAYLRQFFYAWASFSRSLLSQSPCRSPVMRMPRSSVLSNSLLLSQLSTRFLKALSAAKRSFLALSSSANFSFLILAFLSLTFLASYSFTQCSSTSYSRSASSFSATDAFDSKSLRSSSRSRYL